MTVHRWEVKESAEFMMERQRINTHGHSWDNMLSGLRWALARDPEDVGRPTPVEHVFAVPLDTPGDMPNLVVYYRVGVYDVTLLFVVESEEEIF